MAITINGPGTFVWTDSPPDHNPGANGAKFAVNKNTFIGYEHVTATTWVESGDRIQRISGTGAPDYNPGNHQSRLVVNQATPTPGLYLHISGTMWVKLNAETPQTLSIDGQDLTLSGGGGTVTLPSGADFPFLAPYSPTPSYGFSGSAASGMFFDGSMKIQAAEGVTLDILGLDASGDGGGINIQSGAGDTGGGFSIRSGAGASRGGVFVLAAGESAGGQGGSFDATAGNGAQGGTFVMRGGNSTGDENTGGNFILIAGGSTNGAGGLFQATAGNGVAGGYFSLKGGDSTGDESTGGSFSINAGDAAGSEAAGGQVGISGGNATGPLSPGGSVTIQAGTGTSGDGGVSIRCPTPSGGGTIAIGENAASIEIRNATSGNSLLRIVNPYTPTGTSDSKGSTGSLSWDANFIYVKTAAGWKRAALSTF